MRSKRHLNFRKNRKNYSYRSQQKKGKDRDNRTTSDAQNKFIAF
jgi:hypothetical protein